MIDWPTKKRELVNVHLDSRIWNDFRFRDDDIMIASYGKSGCTWLQQIVAQIVFRGQENLPLAEISPWLEVRGPVKENTLARVDQQTHRRIIKTHLPVDALVYHPPARYLLIARDGRDVAWSLFNHFRNLSDSWYKIARNRTGNVIDRPSDFGQFFRRWLDEDGYPFWPFWSHISSWWAVRSLPNLMLLHFRELKANPAGVIRRIAGFIGIDVDDTLHLILEHSRFGYMKDHAPRFVQDGDAVFAGGAGAFFNQGAIGSWRTILDRTDMALYEGAQARNLPADCARWLESGVMDLSRF